MTDFLVSVIVGALVFVLLRLLDAALVLDESVWFAVQTGLGILLVLWLIGSVVRSVYALVQRIIG